MKKRFWVKLLAIVLSVVMTATALPMEALAQTTKSEDLLYLKEIRLAQAETREQAKASLEDDGFIFLEGNLNEGTDEDGVWMGYKTTSDPGEAIYDMRLMNMNGGFTLSSMEEVIKAQKSVFSEMVADLELLINEFVKAYEAGLVPAKKAYMALNFFRMVEDETGLNDANGLGYQLVTGGMSTSLLTEMVMFCDPIIVDSIVKILTMGIQTKNDNWMKKLSKLGPYDGDVVYGKDANGNVRLTENEIKRRAEQLETAIEFYADAYNAFDKIGLVSGTLDENFNIKDAQYKTPDDLTANELSAKKADESRYKIYKVVFDELAKYSFGDGKTLKDFFKSAPKARDLYPLVSVLSDGEFAAMSYGCFLEVATGAGAKASDFDSYDAVYAEATEDVKSIYLYTGVDKALLSDDALVAFTDSATRHMAATGEMEFFENDTLGEVALEKGLLATKCIGAIGMAVISVSRLTVGALMLTKAIISAVASVTIKSAVYAGVMKVCSVIGGPWALLITLAVVAVTLLVSWLIYVIDEAINGTVDWDENPMPEYIYDVRDVVFTQKSENEGIATDYVKRPVFGFYEAVRDENGQVVDLNARSKDSSQWIGLYVSYDKLGDDAKPIKAEDLNIRTGNGETPNGYKPLTRFGEVIAYDLNQWDDEDEVNGIYFFYKQDENAPEVKSKKTYYVSDVYLQKGESPAHCISLLENAGYTPINVNLSPEPKETGFLPKEVYTYLGYKTTTNASNAIRDMRIIYGPNQGEIMLGDANYAECGSNDWVTLYATEYEAAGPPILAGGIMCLNDRDDAPEGYEPVNFFGGGPAVSFNYRQRYVIDFFVPVEQKGIEIHTQEFFVYFLPEQSFTGGTKYVGGISYFFVNNDSLDSLNTANDFWGHYDTTLCLADYMQARTGQGWENFYKNNGGTEALMRDYLILRSGYHSKADGNNLDSVLYYETYNPYRAIYDIKGTNVEDTPKHFSFDGVGYAAWNTLHLSSIKEAHGIGTQEIFIDCNELCEDVPLEMQGKFYVSGNPSGSNKYEPQTGEMSEIQPLKVGEVICDSASNPLSMENINDSAYAYVIDVFRSGHIVVVQNNADRSDDYDYGINTFKFCMVNKNVDRGYVAGVMVADELSIFRNAGGHEKKLDRGFVTDSLLYKQLAAQGATNFCGHRVQMLEITGSRNPTEVNALLFGYARTDFEDIALTDMFIYVNDFSFDEPPKSMVRNDFEYTLLCEIPYNLTGYKGAPAPGVWLYGTYDTLAGSPIIDFDVSDTPFKAGYETIRTQSGRSPWSQLYDMASAHKENHFLGWASELFDDLEKFFAPDRSRQDGHNPYYLHIKREGVPVTEQKPYVEEVYLSYDSDANGRLNFIQEDLFDQGADVFVKANLNIATNGEGLDYIYLGYSLTESVENAVKDIRAYHGWFPLNTFTASNGVKYSRVSDLDLNDGAGGDYIYLYMTKTGDTPITSISAANTLLEIGAVRSETDSDGNTVELRDWAVTKWNTDKVCSNLNEGAGDVPVYLYFTQVIKNAKDGSYREPVSEYDITNTRSGFNKRYLDPDGKYIAELYVMDKQTLCDELGLGQCYIVSESMVFDRLREMGATEIISRPISANSRDFGFWNDNKVYIGFSRTNNSQLAIKDIAIHVELISCLEPAESIDVDQRGYKLVAEAATKVDELPKAINLLSIGDGRQVPFPKMYLYTCSAGNQPPLTDICIDTTPLLEGWNTVRSSNRLDAFVDVSAQAHEQYLLADEDDLKSTDDELIYTDSLFEWMDDISEIFDPAEENITNFYIHTKNYTGMSVEIERPYIEEVYIASGDTRHEALTQLFAFAPDGFVDIDLNKGAGGTYIYLGYKRTAKASDALRDLMICEGKNPAPTRRVEVNGVRIKYELVSTIDLNEEAGGKYLYLYATDSDKIGNPILEIGVVEGDEPEYMLTCGYERNAVLLVENDKFTDVCIDLNKGARGAYLYMYMNRETDAGHFLVGYKKRTEHVDATCAKDGYDLVAETCILCLTEVEKITVIPATGLHVDADGDGDHRCDVCRKNNVTGHVRGDLMIENEVIGNCVTPASYHERYYCTECDKCIVDNYVYVGLIPYIHEDADHDHVCDRCGATGLSEHTPGKVVLENYKEPTCGYSGSYLEVTYCADCGERYQEKQVLLKPTGDHQLGSPYAFDRIDPTCSTKGSYREVIKCMHCGQEVTERTVELWYDYFKHSPGEPVEEDRIEPTENSEGSYKLVVYCSDCGEKLSEETVILPALSGTQPPVGSIFGEGSVHVILSLTGVALLAAILVFLLKRRKK